MNFKDIKFIINHLRKKLHCPKCEETYHEEDIVILSTTKKEAILLLDCLKCSHNILVSVTAEHDYYLPIQFTIKNRHGIVNENDILDMHNFLKNFDGDFSRLMIKKNQ
ncbi:hypothetical protein HYV56_02480 [Candidatus Peregrinibacteria bacterium]|nr:hypothetical protein [Candidatus Peregrinibacteria bacterium]